MRKLWFRTVCAAVCLAMLFGSTGIFAGLREAAAAGATRVAVVKSLKGTVQAKKAGGSKYFDAFKNMSLNEGDTLTTGKDSSVVLELASSKAEQDSITIGANSQVQFTKLKEDNGAKAKMTVWAGSLWVKVKSISNADDSFEVETPTAIMGVRGTHFIVMVDPITGKTTLVVASGVTTVNATNLSGSGGETGPKNVVNVYPTQQADIDQDLQTEDPRAIVGTADPETLVFTLPPEIIEAMVENMAEIRQENEALAEQLAAGVGQGGVADPNANLFLVSSDDLETYTRNMSALLLVILAEAVNQGILSEDAAESLLEHINASIEDPTRRYSLDDVPEYRKEFGLDPALLEEKEKALQDRDQQEKSKEERRREQLSRNGDKVEQIRQDKAQQDQANQEAENAKDRQAFEDHLNALDEQERQELLQRAQQRDQERREQQDQTGEPPGTGTGGTGGGGGGGGGTTPVTNAEISAAYDPDEGVLEIKLHNISDVMAIQADVLYDSNYLTFEYEQFGASGGMNSYRNLKDSPFKVELHNGWQSPDPDYMPNAVDHFTFDTQYDPDLGLGNVQYVVMLFDEDGENEVLTVNIGTDGAPVVRLPFSLFATAGDVGTVVSFNIRFTALTVNANLVVNEVRFEKTVEFTITEEHLYN